MASDAIRHTAEFLVHQLDIIESQHRSEIVPTFGQLQDLFVTKETLKRQLASAVDAKTFAPRRCDTPHCPFIAVDETATGEFHCKTHADEIRALKGRMLEIRPPRTIANSPIPERPTT
jgi:hypothetical protein